MATNIFGKDTTKKYLSSVLLPDGSLVYIKDSEAWEKFNSIAGTVTAAMLYVGITSTALVDGSDASTITIGSGENAVSHEAVAGDVAIYGDLEFVYNGSTWLELGRGGLLKALAFADKVSGNVTLQGTAQAQDFTGTTENIKIELENGSFESSGTVTAAGNVRLTLTSATDGNANFTPGGTISDITVTLDQTSLANLAVDEAGSVTAGRVASFTKDSDQFVEAKLGETFYTPGEDGQAPELETSSVKFKGVQEVQTALAGQAAAWSATMASDESETLVFSWTANVPTQAGSIVTTESLEATKVDKWDAGAAGKTAKIDTTQFSGGSFTEGDYTFDGGAPTVVSLTTFTENPVNYVTGVKSVSTPTFTGTPTVIEASFTGTPQNITVEGTTNVSAKEYAYTPAGTNSTSTTTVSGVVELFGVENNA